MAEENARKIGKEKKGNHGKGGELDRAQVGNIPGKIHSAFSMSEVTRGHEITF